MTILTTPRLRLEPLSDSHFEGFHAMNSDPEVMRHLTGRPETPDETRAVIARVQARWADTGYSWWALLSRESGELVGAAALQNLRREMQPLPDRDCPLEIGWRLRREHWGQGYASEAARAIGDYAFDTLSAPEILAVCSPVNTASSDVMRRIGMRDRGVQRWYGMEQTTYGASADEWAVSRAARARA